MKTLFVIIPKKKAYKWAVILSAYSIKDIFKYKKDVLVIAIKDNDYKLIERRLIGAGFAWKND